MGRIKVILGLAVAVVAIAAGGQVGLAEWTNLQFQDDLHDVAASVGQHIGMNAVANDDDLRKIVLRKAEGRGITLEPKQVTVRHTGAGEPVSLGVDYDVVVSLHWYSFELHFSPASTKKVF